MTRVRVFFPTTKGGRGKREPENEVENDVVARTRDALKRSCSDGDGDRSIEKLAQISWLVQLVKTNSNNSKQTNLKNNFSPETLLLFPKFTSRNSVSSAKAEHHPPREPLTVLFRRAW